jgi:hypothetical protein
MFFIFILLSKRSLPDISEHTDTDKEAGPKACRLVDRSLDQKDTTAKVGVPAIGQEESGRKRGTMCQETLRGKK